MQAFGVVLLMNTLTIHADTWLAELFEYEYCEECHGDTRDHDVIDVMGNWFARCKPDARCRVDCDYHMGVYAHVWDWVTT